MSPLICQELLPHAEYYKRNGLPLKKITGFAAKREYTDLVSHGQIHGMSHMCDLVSHGQMCGKTHSCDLVNSHEQMSGMTHTCATWLVMLNTFLSHLAPGKNPCVRQAFYSAGRGKGNPLLHAEVSVRMS